MEIIVRKDAIKTLSPTYYTGKPCSNGHLTYRYTKSGSCAGCVASSNDKTRGTLGHIPTAPYGEQRENRKAITEAMTALVEMKVRAYPSDFGMIKDTAAALTISRYPALTVAHVVGQRGPTDGDSGTYMYRMRCHADDVALVRDTANALLSLHTIDLTARLLEINRAQSAQIDAITPDLPAWKP